MHSPVKPKPEWRALMDEMALISTEEYRSIVFKEPRFIEYFQSVSVLDALNCVDIDSVMFCLSFL